MCCMSDRHGAVSMSSCKNPVRSCASTGYGEPKPHQCKKYTHTGPGMETETEGNESTKVQNPRRNSYAVNSRQQLWNSYAVNSSYAHTLALCIYCACAYEYLAAPSRPSPVSRLFHAVCTSS